MSIDVSKFLVGEVLAFVYDQFHVDLNGLNDVQPGVVILAICEFLWHS
jgi:hypothetical protein